MEVAIQNKYLAMSCRLGRGDNCCVSQIHRQVSINLHQRGGAQIFRNAKIKQDEPPVNHQSPQLLLGGVASDAMQYTSPP